MALVSIGLETLVFEPDAQTTRPPPVITIWQYATLLKFKFYLSNQLYIDLVPAKLK